jgi:hypothetical protein
MTLMICDATVQDVGAGARGNLTKHALSFGEVRCNVFWSAGRPGIDQAINHD